MRTRHASKNGTDLRPRTGKDLVVSHNQRSGVNIIVWGLQKELTTLEVHAKFADMGQESFIRGNVLWEGDHIRLVLTKKDSKGVSSELVKQVSAILRKIGCRCVIDEQVRKTCKSRVMSVPVNRFESLAVDTCSDDSVEDVHVVDSVALKTKVLASKMRKQLRLATWNVSGLCSERKQKVIAYLLACNSIDIVAVQQSWEKEDSKIDIDGYKWFGKPRSSQRSQRGEGVIGFLVLECLVSEVEFITAVAYEESVWMKVRGERGRLALYIGCVYMPTDSTSVAVLDTCYERLSFREKGKVVLLGDLNARVGKAADDDDVIGKFGEDTCNASGNKLISLLREVELVACNGRQLVSEPEWTRVRPSLDQKPVM